MKNQYPPGYQKLASPNQAQVSVTENLKRLEIQAISFHLRPKTVAEKN
jgi:hypothetical protein